MDTTAQKQPGSLGTLTLALSLIALGTVGPLALFLLGGLAVAISFQKGGGSFAPLVSAGVLCMIVMVLAFIGQVLCFFSPLSSQTKTRLAICMVFSVLNIPLSGLISAICGFVTLIAYLAFLYGVANDLDSPAAIKGFNSAALLGFLAMAGAFASPFLAIFAPSLMLICFLGCFGLGAVAFARYAQSIILLAVRANELRVQAPQATQAVTGFTSFNETQPALFEPKPAKPNFEMEGSQFLELPANLPALHEATRLGDNEKVNWILRSGGKVDDKASHGLTPLHVASISGVMAVADLLLKRGANVDEVSEGGLTALYYAIQANNANLVGLLMSRGASLRHTNDQGRTPLHWACAVPGGRLEGQARVKMAQMLIARGADPQALDVGGKTPQALALEAGHSEMAEL